jgi:hypothetical protein
MKLMVVPGLSSHEKRLDFCRDTKEVVTGRTLEEFCEIRQFEVLSPQNISIRSRGKYAMRYVVICIFFRCVLTIVREGYFVEAC